MKVRLEVPIMIPAGLILHDAPRRTVCYEPYCAEELVSRLEITEDYVMTHPDRFTVLED